MTLRRAKAFTVSPREQTFTRKQFDGYGGIAGPSGALNVAFAQMTKDRHTVGGCRVSPNTATIAEIDQVMGHFNIPRLQGGRAQPKS